MRKWIMRLIFIGYEGPYIDEEDGDRERECENGVESDDPERQFSGMESSHQASVYHLYYASILCYSHCDTDDKPVYAYVCYALNEHIF